MRLKVFCTAVIPRAGIDLLEAENFQVRVYDQDSAAPAQEIVKELEQAHALISMLSDRIDATVLQSAARLKIVANYAVGYNNIDLEAARQRGIVVTNTPDVLTAATADLTWALLLAVTRRIPQSDQFLRSGRFKGWRPELMLGGDIKGKTIGIIGAGRIGRAVAKRALGFDMKILYHSKHRRTEFEGELGAVFCPLEQLLAQSDFITLHCPLVAETRHLINQQNINMIKKGAYLINTARGPVVDEMALIAALQSGHLAGAGLDVYEQEPLVPQELVELENVVLLPHVGSATYETRTEMGRICARNIIEVLHGRPALTPVI